MSLSRLVAFVAMTVLAPVGASAADRVALVIGMGAYEHITPLDNAIRDATAIAGTLEDIGFHVTRAIDTPLDPLLRTLDDFAFRAETADLALIYFAGHGVQVQGENFLVPVDADVTSNRDIQRQSVSLKNFLQVVDSARKMRIVILDSCRDNPFGDSLDLAAVEPAEDVAPGVATRGAGGLAPASPDRGTLVAYAAKDGLVALDGQGTNSPFAAALIDKLPEKGLEISLMFRQVRDQVLRETNNLQEPHTYGSLSGVPFYLAGPADGQRGLSDSDPVTAWSSLRPEEEPQLVAMAEAGDTRSMVGLAYKRLNTAGQFDPEAAFDLFSRAAAAGDPVAQFELAKLYEKGMGVPADRERALELFEASAAQDFPDALNDLGYMHYQGALGLPRDPRKALTYFERAANQRHPAAQFNFAALIDDGLIDDKGPEDAASYLYAALRSGSSDVLNILETSPNMFTLETRRALQAKLKEREFYTGAIDGSFGPGTNRGLRKAYGLEG